MKTRTLIKAISGELQRLQSDSFAQSARQGLDALTALLPSGSGIDSGMQILVDDSKPNRVKLLLKWHHMNEAGFYDGWTQHLVTVTPCFVFGMEIKISGLDRNGIKDYMAELLQFALSQPIMSEFDSTTRTMRYSIRSEL